MQASRSTRLQALLIATWLGLAACGAESQEGPRPLAPDEAFLRWRLSEAEVEALFEMKAPELEYDPDTYRRRKAHWEKYYRWPEHPDGGFTMRTNGAHLREDDEISETAPDLRILVTGDSHTDGVCNNSESYTNVLERQLREAYPGKRVEALNAGHGGFSFYNFLGVLHKYMETKPRVFIIGVFGGNDFAEALAPFHYLHGHRRPTAKGDYEVRLRVAEKIRDRAGFRALNQGFNQLVYFQQHPDQVEIAYQAAETVLREIQRVCDENGIRMIVVYIPPPADVQPERFDGLFDEVSEALALTPGARVLNDLLASRLLRFLRARGIEVIDGRDVFAGSTELLYWKFDQHINLVAHQLLAEALVPLLESELRE
jgi:hypothetical protein